MILHQTEVIPDTLSFHIGTHRNVAISAYQLSLCGRWEQVSGGNGE